MRKSDFLKKYTSMLILLIVVGLAGITLVKSPKQAMQATDPIFAVIEFQGDYKIGEGEWLPLAEKTHISATKGPVTLKGHFKMKNPETYEVMGNVYPGTNLAVYLNHLSMIISIKDQMIYRSDVENPALSSVGCGQIWEIFATPETEEPLVILLENNHKYGNENAVDEFLDSCCVYLGGVFERQQAEKGELQRLAGMAIVLSAMAIWGTALFTHKIHVKNSYEIGLIGGIILFAGIYYIFSSENICLWYNNYRINTSILCLCEELYLLFITIFILKILSEKTYSAGKIFVGISLCTMTMLFFVSILDICMIYDTWFIWGVVEFFVSLGLLVCLFLERDNLNRENALVYSVDIFILLSYIIDFIAVYFGWWENTRLSMMFFVFIFIAAATLVLKVIPENLEAIARAKELEAEQKLLQAKLHESRISVMMSQIQPHFIYNSLAVIQELCHGEPEKAETAIGTLAEFLKGNMAISLSDKLVSFEDELKHTQKYLEIEHLRFEDQLRVVYDIRAGGFCIPALTIQPIVENAVRHGVRKKEEGGTVKITAAENENGFEIWVEDDGPGFRNIKKTDGKGIHLGIENVRERLERMCEGELEIVSEEGKGTRVIIRIKKEFGTC